MPTGEAALPAYAVGHKLLDRRPSLLRALARRRQLRAGGAGRSTYLALKQLRWLDEGRLRTQAHRGTRTTCAIALQRRLLHPGLEDTLDKQLASFIRAVRRARSSDYDNVQLAVAARLRVRGPWSAERREKLRRVLLQEEVGHVPNVSLPARDPWVALLSKLPVGLSKVAASGIPAFGTRTRWTLALVKSSPSSWGPTKPARSCCTG